MTRVVVAITCVSRHKTENQKKMLTHVVEEKNSRFCSLDAEKPPKSVRTTARAHRERATQKKSWRLQGLNPRLLPCKGTALHLLLVGVFVWFVFAPKTKPKTKTYAFYR